MRKTHRIDVRPDKRMNIWLSQNPARLALFTAPPYITKMSDKIDPQGKSAPILAKSNDAFLVHQLTTGTADHPTWLIGNHTMRRWHHAMQCSTHLPKHDLFFFLRCALCNVSPTQMIGTILATSANTFTVASVSPSMPYSEPTIQYPQPTL